MHTDGQQLVITCNCVSGDTGPEVTCWVVHLRSSHLQVSLTGLRFKVTVICYLWGETKKKRKKKREITIDSKLQKILPLCLARGL